MTASEILRLATTVATVQIICDLVANWRVFNREPYQRALGALSRAKTKLEREQAAVAKETTTTTTTAAPSSKKGGKAEKLAKRLLRAEEDHADAIAVVARKHMVPSVLTSLIFVILLRILGTEHQGNIMGILPFTPFSLLKRLTARGLEFSNIQFEPVVTDKVTDTSQACSFMFIYFLCAFSVKYYASRIVGTRHPPGAESILSMVDSPQGRKMMKSVGIDPNALKME